jgi:hypothetical protein
MALLCFFTLLGASNVQAAETEKQKAEKRFKKFEDYCQGRRVTHVIELLVEWREYVGFDERQHVLEMTNAIYEDAIAAHTAAAKSDGKRAAHRPPRLSFGQRVVTSERGFASGHMYVGETCVLRTPEGGGGAERPRVRDQLLVASREFEVASEWSSVEKCVILSNAEATVIGKLEDSLLLATGRVTVQDVEGSDLAVRAEVAVKTGLQSLIVTGRDVVGWGGKKLTADSPQYQNTMTANDTKLLGVKFYSSAEDGLEATAVKGVVTVSKVDEKKPFAVAGVKKGDVIEKVNGEPVPSLHELDRLLCRATVASGIARLKLKRGDETHVIEVKLADW